MAQGGVCAKHDSIPKVYEWMTLASFVSRIQSYLLKVSKSRKQFMAKWILQKNERWISALEDYYFKVNTKRESMFFLQEDRLSFVLTLK